MSTLRLHRLTAEKFKRLRVVDLRLDECGNLIQVTGPNGAGKTSILDAVCSGLAGKNGIPDRPCNTDANGDTQVTLDLGEFTVTRKWSSDDKSVLTVKSRDGARYPSPQAMLDEIVGRLTFDPLEFMSMKPKDQTETLRKITGADFSALDKRRAEIYSQRTETNRTARDIEGEARQMPFHTDAPPQRVSMYDLTNQHKAACEKNSANAAQRQSAMSLYDKVIAANSEVEKARKALVDLEANAANLATEYNAAYQAALTLEDADTSMVAALIEGAEEANKKIEDNERRETVQVRLRATEAKALDLTKLIDEIDAEKARILAATTFPVEGLGFDGDTVTFKGLPLSSASSAQQLRISLAIGASLNPKLRLMLIRDGSLLDSEGLRAVKAFLDENDYQAIMERVADRGQGVGFQIEDGQASEWIDDPGIEQVKAKPATTRKTAVVTTAAPVA